MAGFNPQADYDRPEFEPLSKGWHVAFITQTRLGTSKKGDPMLTIRYEVIGDQHTDGVGRRLYEYCLLTDQWFWKLKQVVLAARPDVYGRDDEHPDGFPSFDGTGDHDEDQKAVQQWLLGRPFAFNVKAHKRETYQGETRLREVIDNYQPLGEAHLDKLEAVYNRGNGELTPELPDDALDEGNGSNGHGAARSRFDDTDIPF